ncbi:MAG: hypothetical protein MJZ30_11910, partial [Paludibacteraceae bacterium]|nr:hypothetical protein [Paludibacteraceae bacterium]
QGIAEGRVEGRAEGRVEGRIEGRAEGEISERAKNIASLKAYGMSKEEISQALQIPLEEIN